MSADLRPYQQACGETLVPLSTPYDPSVGPSVPVPQCPKVAHGEGPWEASSLYKGRVYYTSWCHVALGLLIHGIIHTWEYLQKWSRTASETISVGQAINMRVFKDESFHIIYMGVHVHYMGTHVIHTRPRVLDMGAHFNDMDTRVNGMGYPSH